MRWLAEHADQVYFLFALSAFVLAGVWWIQRQLLYLVGAGVMLLGLLGAWLVLRNVSTDAKELQANLHSLSEALIKKDRDKALSFVADEFKYKSKSAEKWYDLITEWIDDYKISDFRVNDFEIKSLDRSKSEAKTHFQIEAIHKSKPIFSAGCTWEWELDGEAWKVRKVSTSKAVFKADKDVSVTDEK